jgi:hypothetical protein
MDTKTCPRCREDKPLAEFGFRSKPPYQANKWCKDCCSNRSARFYRMQTPEQKEDRKAIQARYREGHREKINADEKVRRDSNPERERVRQVTWKRGLREQMIAAYGGACSCCGETRYEFLTLDHVNGGGHKDRKTRSTDSLLCYLRDQGWPKSDYTVLCWNCNASKGVYGFCPHERERG